MILVSLWKASMIPEGTMLAHAAVRRGAAERGTLGLQRMTRVVLHEGIPHEAQNDRIHGPFFCKRQPTELRHHLAREPHGHTFIVTGK